MLTKQLAPSQTCPLPTSIFKHVSTNKLLPKKEGR